MVVLGLVLAYWATRLLRIGLQLLASGSLFDMGPAWALLVLGMYAVALILAACALSTRAFREAYVWTWAGRMRDAIAIILDGLWW